MGNPGDVKPTQSGINELRINHGLAYNVYSQHRGRTIVLLCFGEDKRTQGDGIPRAARVANNWKGKKLATKRPRRVKEVLTRCGSADYLKSKEDRGLPASVPGGWRRRPTIRPSLRELLQQWCTLAT